MQTAGQHAREQETLRRFERECVNDAPSSLLHSLVSLLGQGRPLLAICVGCCTLKPRLGVVIPGPFGAIAIWQLPLSAL